MRLIALDDKFIVDMITSKVEKMKLIFLQSITVFFSVVMMLTDKKLSKESKDSVGLIQLSEMYGSCCQVHVTSGTDDI